MKNRSVRDEQDMRFYIAAFQQPSSRLGWRAPSIRYIVRTAANDESLITRLQQTVHAADPRVLVSITSMPALVERTFVIEAIDRFDGLLRVDIRLRGSNIEFRLSCTEKAERVEHHLELQNIAADELLEVSEAQGLAGRVVDAAQFGNGIGMFANIDVDGLPIRPPRHSLPRIGYQHRSRLRLSVPAVAAKLVVGGQCFNETVREIARGTFTRLERLRYRFDDIRTDEGVSLHCDA